MSLDEKIVLLKEKKEKLENLKIEAQLQEDILKLDKEYEKVNERLIEIENEKFEELKERHSSLFENKNNKIKM
jgi:DNA mismatch repair ATPase MutS